MNKETAQVPQICIEPIKPWGFIDLKELNHYRDLLFFMVWRTVKVAYAQTVGGFAWAIAQPAFQILVFSIVFGGLLNVDSGGLPYPLITTVAVIPWNYIAGTMTASSNALVANRGMLGKVYFPRVIFLLVPVIGNLIPFLISILLMIGVLVYYDVGVTRQMFYLPLLLLFMMLTPLSIGFWLSSLAIRFRDVQLAMGMLLKMLIYVVPVMYVSDTIPAEYRQYYILNPLVGIIEGFRSCLLGTPIYWDSMMSCAVITAVLLFTGVIYFQRMERVIVDVI